MIPTFHVKPVSIYIRPGTRIGFYEVEHAGEVILANSRVPSLDACRVLIARGIDPATPLEMYRGTMLALRVRSIGEGARLTVREDGKLTPRLTSWKADPRYAMASPMRSNDDPSGGQRGEH